MGHFVWEFLCLIKPRPSSQDLTHLNVQTNADLTVHPILLTKGD